MSLPVRTKWCWQTRAYDNLEAFEGKTSGNLAENNSGLITNNSWDSKQVGMQSGMKNVSFCLGPDD